MVSADILLKLIGDTPEGELAFTMGVEVGTSEIGAAEDLRGLVPAPKIEPGILGMIEDAMRADEVKEAFGQYYNDPAFLLPCPRQRREGASER